MNSITSPLTFNQADYLKLLMQELTYQDPLKPLDNREFMTQLAQFSLLSQVQEGNETVNVLKTLTQQQQALGLLGKQVTLKDKAEQFTEGTVYKIAFNAMGDAQLMIEANGQLIKRACQDVIAVRL